MMCHNEAVWELPEFKINAGETKTLRFPIYTPSQRLIDVAGMDGTFALSDYVNRGASLFTKTCQGVDDNEFGGTIFAITLQSSDTATLCGKYIYQLTIRDSTNGSVGVLRGVVMIGHNSDVGASQ